MGGALACGRGTVPNHARLDLARIAESKKDLAGGLWIHTGPILSQTVTQKAVSQLRTRMYTSSSGSPMYSSHSRVFRCLHCSRCRPSRSSELRSTHSLDH